MARRQFDSSFSRRTGSVGSSNTGGGSQSQYSLLGEPSGLSALGGSSYGHRSSGGGGGGYDDDYSNEHERYSGGGGVSLSQLGDYEDAYDRVPRDGSSRSKTDYGGSGASGGWRQRSPSPSSRFASRSQDSDRVSRNRAPQQQKEPEWTRPSQQRESTTMRDRESLFETRNRLELELQQNQFQNSNPFMSSLQNNTSTGILRNPLGQQDQSVVMVLPHGQASAGSLMGNMGMVQAGNPFGVLGQQPVIVGNLPAFNQSAFAQQLIQQSPVFSQGIGQQQPLNIYGPQTQQGFNRFEMSQQQQQRSGSAGDGRRSSVRNNDRSSGGNRRSDARTSAAGAGSNKPTSGQGKNNNDPSSRKRNLVLRDPRPEEVEASARKRPRNSRPRGNRGGANKGGTNRQSAGGNPNQVKRISIGTDKPPAKNNRYKRKADLEKDKKDKAVNGTEGAESAAGEKEVPGDTKKTEGGGQQNKKDKKEKDRKTQFDEFPTSILVCKVCQKVMNDGSSFESHLSGRAHVSLMKILEERFIKRSELLMLESKCAEEEIGIEMERQRRAGKGGRPDKNSNNYCKMCDCNYVVNWGTHKVSLGHRVLKEFLHPTCRFCNAHFMHRIEWVNHLLSHSHLQRINEIKAEGTTPLGEQESPSQDELFAVNMDLTRDERPTNAITIRSLDGKEALTEEMKEILKNDRGEIVLPVGEIPIPEKYDENVEIGEEAIVGVSGSRCRVCRVYIAEDKDVEGHCKTKEHFNMYVSFLKRVVRHREHKDEEKKAAEEKAKKEEERKQRDSERAAKKKLEQSTTTDKNTEGSTPATPVKSEKESVMEVDGDKDKDESKTEETSESKLNTSVDKDQDGKATENEMIVLDEVDGEEENAEEDEDETEVIEDEQNGDVEMTTEQDGEPVDASEKTHEGNDDGVVVAKETSEGNDNVTVAEVEKTAEAAVLNNSTTDVKNVDVAEPVSEETKIKSQESNVEMQELKDGKEKEQQVTEPVVNVPALPVTPTKAAQSPTKPSSPQTATRGGPRGRAGFIRGTPARGRGNAHALKNVTPRVDTNYRGGGNARGQGQARGGRNSRGSSPQRGGRGGRGRGGR